MENIIKGINTDGFVFATLDSKIDESDNNQIQILQLDNNIYVSFK